MTTIISSSETTPLDGLTQLLKQQSAEYSSARRIPPLEKWYPANCGDMDLVIKANGEWWHDGRKMTRQSMIDLFASVLWAEEQADGKLAYFLKTPVEKIGICVEDVPLFITQVDTLEKDGKKVLQFITSHGDTVIADDKHPLELRLPVNASLETPSQLYILVRQNGESKIYAKIHRNVFFHLIEMGELTENESEAGIETCLTLKSGDFEFYLTVLND